MALPEINETISFTQTDLPSGKKIGIKPWKMKEEKELLYALEGIDNQLDGKREIVKLIRKCVDNQVLFDKLSNTDYIYLVAKTRKLSKGTSIEFVCKCQKEGCIMDQLSSDVSVDTDLKVKPFDSSIITVNDDLKISIKEVSFTEYDIINQQFSKQVERNFNYVVKSIETIVYKGEVYEEIAEDEIVKFLDSLPPNDFNYLAKQIEVVGAEIKLEKTVVCGRCKNENVIDFGDLYYFLVF